MTDMKSTCLVWIAAGTLLAVVEATAAPDEPSAVREKTSFQTGGEWKPTSP